MNEAHKLLHELFLLQLLHYALSVTTRDQLLQEVKKEMTYSFA